MNAGDLRSKVGFYKRPPNDASPDYGAAEGEFLSTAEFTCAANIKPRLGGEQVLAQRLSGTNLVNITVRASSRASEVDTAWMVKDERSGVQYNIRSIIDPYEHTSERGKWIELLCEKGVAV